YLETLLTLRVESLGSAPVDADAVELPGGRDDVQPAVAVDVGHQMLLAITLLGHGDAPRPVEAVLAAVVDDELIDIAGLLGREWLQHEVQVAVAVQVGHRAGAEEMLVQDGA